MFFVDHSERAVSGLPDFLRRQRLEKRDSAAEADLTLLALLQMTGDAGKVPVVAASRQRVIGKRIVIDMVHDSTRVIDSKMVRAALRQ
ncbi:MAG TPA: hypothetical protein VGQ21_02580 [Thermoanaerobaculia bacterium]|nr:hypothetical protein [Thermoanaerobaculia bacterium]